MKVALLIFGLAIGATTAKAQDIPAGKLGHLLGQYLRIEGFKSEKPTMWGYTFRVDTVNSNKLEKPIDVFVRGVELPKDARCVLRGYETGSMIGTPPAVIEASKEKGKDVTVQQAGWQFHRVFIVLSVIEPKDLNKK